MAQIEGNRGLLIHAMKKENPKRLWFGNIDGRCVGTLSHRSSLKKLRRWIDEILEQPK